MALKYLIVAGLLVVVAVVLVLPAAVMRPGALPAQPIAFNHRLHLENAQGISCQDCHQFVNSQTYAGLPSKFICFDCHSVDFDDQDTESKDSKGEIVRLMTFAKTTDDIPWQRVTHLPDDVFFSHRRHVVVAKVDCRECHPGMPERTSPPTRGPIKMRMSACIDCHSKTGASVDCISCHR